MSVLIGIDAGHGGRNKGCRVADGWEKDVNLAICSALQESCVHGFDTELIRPTDRGMSPVERAEVAAGMGCDFVLTVHINAIANRLTSGFEGYYMHDDPLSKAVAMHLRDASAAWFTKQRTFEAHDNPFRRDDDWLERPENCIEEYGMRGIPATLAECCYSTNSDDLALLTSPMGFEAMASILRSGVVYAAHVLSDR